MKKINKIEQSLKENIRTGELESWSKSKNYVDNEHKNNVFIPNGIAVCLTANITGLHLPTLWKTVKKQLYSEDLEQFGNTFGDVDELFNHEDEILAVTPTNYQIYNLDTIKQQMEG